MDLREWDIVKLSWFVQGKTPQDSFYEQVTGIVQNYYELNKHMHRMRLVITILRRRYRNAKGIYDIV